MVRAVALARLLDFDGQLCTSKFTDILRNTLVMEPNVVSSLQVIDIAAGLLRA